MSFGDFLDHLQQFAHQNNLVHTDPIEALEDTRVAVDGLILLRIILQKCQPFNVLNGVPRTAFKEKTQELLNALKKHNVKLCVVFPQTIQEPNPFYYDSITKLLWKIDYMRTVEESPEEKAALEQLTNRIVNSIDFISTHYFYFIRKLIHTIESEDVEYLFAPSSLPHQLRWLYSNDFASCFLGSPNILFFSDVSAVIIDINPTTSEISFLETDELLVDALKIKKEKKFECLAPLQLLYSQGSQFLRALDALGNQENKSTEWLLDLLDQEAQKTFEKRMAALSDFIKKGFFNIEGFLEKLFKEEGRVWVLDDYSRIRKKTENAYVFAESRIMHYPKPNDKTTKIKVEEVMGEYPVQEIMFYSVIGILPSTILELPGRGFTSIGHPAADSQEIRKYWSETGTSSFLTLAGNLLVKYKKLFYFSRKFEIRKAFKGEENTQISMKEYVSKARSALKLYCVNPEGPFAKSISLVTFKNIVQLLKNMIISQKEPEKKSDDVRVVDISKDGFYWAEIFSQTTNYLASIMLTFLQNNQYLNFETKSVKMIGYLLLKVQPFYESLFILLMETLSLGYLHGRQFTSVGLKEEKATDHLNLSSQNKDDEIVKYLRKGSMELGTQMKEEQASNPPSMFPPPPSPNEPLCSKRLSSILDILPETAIQASSDLRLKTIEEEVRLYIQSKGEEKGKFILEQWEPENRTHDRRLEWVVFIARVFSVIDLSGSSVLVNLPADFSSVQFLSVLEDVQKGLYQQICMILANTFWNKKKAADDIQTMLQIRASLPFQNMLNSCMLNFMKIALTRFLVLSDIKRKDTEYYNKNIGRVTFASLSKEFQVENIKKLFESGLELWKSVEEILPTMDQRMNLEARNSEMRQMIEESKGFLKEFLTEIQF